MIAVKHVFRRLAEDRSAVTTIEYAVAAAGIIAVAAAAFSALGSRLSNAISVIPPA